MQRIIRFGWVFVLPFALAGCVLFGGGTPDDRVSSIKRSKNYQIHGDPNWTPIDRADSDSAFRLRSDNIVTLTSSCDRDASQPLEVLTKHLLIGARKIQIVKRESILIDNTTGLYSHIRAHFENRPFELHIFVISKANCVFDFSLMGPGRVADSEVLEFMSFARSFRYVSK